MLKKALLFVCAAMALAAVASAEIPIPPCDPCVINTTLAR